EEQSYAVDAVLGNSRGGHLLLLLGPPGTGKSLALAEAICQLLLDHVRALSAAADAEAPQPPPASRMLLCAPTEIACDLLVETVHRRLQPRDGGGVTPVGMLLRFNEPRRPLQQIVARGDVLPYCCINQQTGCFQYPDVDEVSAARWRAPQSSSARCGRPGACAACWAARAGTSPSTTSSSRKRKAA
ncbi:unnamed protein product, partial [Prorocentrum cordatum]